LVPWALTAIVNMTTVSLLDTPVKRAGSREWDGASQSDAEPPATALHAPLSAVTTRQRNG
jgi:hypothetical protein